MKPYNYCMLWAFMLLQLAFLMGCTTLQAPTQPDGCLAVGKLTLTREPIGQIKKGIAIEIESEDGEHIIPVDVEPDGYFFVPNIPHRKYFLSRITIHKPRAGRSRTSFIRLPKRSFFTAQPDRVVVVGAYDIWVSADLRTISRRQSLSVKAAKSKLSKDYANSRWLGCEFVTAQTQGTPSSN